MNQSGTVQPSTSGGLHYGWVIVGCTLMALLVSNGMTISGLTVFDNALLGEFKWSRGAYKLGGTITFIVAGLLGPLAGGIADRSGVRPLMTLGAIMLSAGFLQYSRVSSLTDVYLAHLLFGVALACVGLVVNVLLVSRWFTTRRGTAIGLALVGTSLGGSVFPPINTSLLADATWREVFRQLALVPLILIPIVWLFVRDWPRDKGLEPYGGAPAGSAARGELPGMEYGAALRTVNFWALAFAATATFYAILAMTAHLFLHLTTGLGFPAPTAAAAVGTLFLLGLAGKFLFGAAADFFNRKLVFVGNLIVMLIGTLFLLMDSTSTLWPAVVLTGLGWGGLYTMLQLLVVESFGIRAAGRILGTITVMDAIGGGLGVVLTGVLFDSTGSYRVAFGVISALVAMALIAATLVKPPQLPESAR
jgi:MFS family permease